MEFNGTFLASIITFLVFVYLMNKVLYQPMADIVSKRKNIIDENYQKADELEKKAESIEAEVEEKLSTARDEAREKYLEVIDGYKEQRVGIIREAQDISKEELESAYAALDNVSNEAKEGLKSKMTDLANDIAEKVLGYRSEVQGFDVDKVNEILYQQKG